MRIINRLKTLYWFWRLTRDVENKWVMRTGKIDEYKNFIELWNNKGEYARFCGVSEPDLYFIGDKKKNV